MSRKSDAETTQRLLAQREGQVEELRRLMDQASAERRQAVEELAYRSPTFTATKAHEALLNADSTHSAVRVAVLMVVLCYENLRDALQFDTWGGLQDATSLDERAQVLRGWLGTIADEEMAAATACYDELAGA